MKRETQASQLDRKRRDRERYDREAAERIAQARLLKALKLVEVLDRSHADYDYVANATREQRALTAAAAGTNFPGDDTWALVVRTFERRAQQPADPFEGLT